MPNTIPCVCRVRFRPDASVEPTLGSYDIAVAFITQATPVLRMLAIAVGADEMITIVEGDGAILLFGDLKARALFDRALKRWGAAYDELPPGDAVLDLDDMRALQESFEQEELEHHQQSAEPSLN